MTQYPDPPPDSSAYQPEYYAQRPAPDRGPVSVKVIAIIGIVVTSLGVLCTPLSLVQLFVKLPGPPNPVTDLMYDNSVIRTVTLVQASVGIALSVFGLCASIAVLRWRAWGRTGMNVYAIVSIVQGLAGVAFLVLYEYPKIYAAVPPAQRPYVIGGLAGGGVGLLVGFAFPICVLIFLNRPKAKAAFARAAAEARV